MVSADNSDDDVCHLISLQNWKLFPTLHVTIYQHLYTTIQQSVTQYNTVWHITTQYNTIQHTDTMQQTMIQYNTVW